MATYPKCKQKEQTRRPAKVTDISKYILIRFTYILNQTSSSHFRLKLGHRNERKYYVH